MNDEDMPDDESAVEWFKQEVRKRGVRIAYNGLIGVLQDPKAAAPAKATAGVAILRAAGVFATADDVGGKSVDQMSASEMDAELQRIRTRCVTLKRITEAEAEAEAEAQAEAEAENKRNGGGGSVFD